MKTRRGHADMNAQYSTMKDLLPADRPREKLLRHGVTALGDNELVALVLGSGSSRAGALAIANAVLRSRGGVHGLAQLRHVLTSMGVLVVPQGRGITAAHTAFDDEGRLKDAAQQAAIEAIVQRLVDLVRRHAD